MRRLCLVLSVTMSLVACGGEASDVPDSESVSTGSGEASTAADADTESEESEASEGDEDVSSAMDAVTATLTACAPPQLPAGCLLHGCGDVLPVVVGIYKYLHGNTEQNCQRDERTDKPEYISDELVHEGY